jgi:hypothetical protein
MKIAALSTTLFWVAQAGCHALPIHGHTVSSTPACSPDWVRESSVPGVDPAQEQVDYWSARSVPSDQVLLDPAGIRTLNRQNAQKDVGFRDVLAPEIGANARVEKDLNDRIQWLSTRLQDGTLIEETQGSFVQAVEQIRNAQATDELRIVHREATLHCIPLQAGLYSPPIDRDFNRNRCSGLHPGELVRVLRRTSTRWVYVHTGHSVGWMHPDHLTPPLTEQSARQFRDDPQRLVATNGPIQTESTLVLRLGSSFPLSERRSNGTYVILGPTPTGLQPIVVAGNAPVHIGYLPFTRRNLWSLALSQLGQEYGWGGRGGHRDCSRLVMDVFSTFGIRLSRHSSYQRQNGTAMATLQDKTETEKMALLQEMARQGVVLLYMRGHIMILLGQNEERLFAVSSLSEYVRPCGDGGEQVVRIDKVTVSDLELGRNTERTAFMERLTTATVFAP